MSKNKKIDAVEPVVVEETIIDTPDIVTEDIQDEVIEESQVTPVQDEIMTEEPIAKTVVEPEIKSGEEREYMVVLGTPSYFIIKSDDGLRTIRCSNTYKRGDIVKL